MPLGADAAPERLNLPQPKCEHGTCRWTHLGTFAETEKLAGPPWWQYTGRRYRATICEVDGLCWEAERRRLEQEQQARIRRVHEVRLGRR